MAYIPRPRATKPQTSQSYMKPENPDYKDTSNYYNSTGTYVGKGDYINGSYSSNGRTFERDQYNNFIVKDGQGNVVNTYGVGTREHNLARKELERVGGNWDSMRAQQPTIRTSGAVLTAPKAESAVLNQIQDSGRMANNLAPRPDVYVPINATPDYTINRAGDLYWENHGSPQWEREKAFGAESELLNANDISTRNAVALAEANRAKIQQRYDDEERQAYINNARGQRYLEESLALQGLSGGAAESARLAHGNEYQAGMNRLALAEQAAYQDLDTQINDIRAQGDIKAAEIRARQAEQEMQLRQQAIQQGQEMYLRLMSQRAQQQNADRDYQFKVDSLNYDREFQNRAYADERADAAFKQNIMQQQHDWDMRNQALKYQQASLKAGGGTAKRYSGGSSGYGGSAVGSSSYGGNLNLYPTESALAGSGGNSGLYVTGAATQATQNAQANTSQQIRNAIKLKQDAENDLRQGRITVNEFNIIARDVEQFVRGLGY